MMSEFDDLKKQLKKNNWFDFWLIICLKENARTEEKQIELAKHILYDPGCFKPGSVFGFYACHLQSYSAKATPWLRCHLDESDLSVEEYQKRATDVERNTFSLPPYKGDNNV